MPKKNGPQSVRPGFLVRNPDWRNTATFWIIQQHQYAIQYFYGGVKNVFNDKGPFVPRTGDTYERGIGNFDSKFEGGIGRFIFLGVEWRM